MTTFTYTALDKTGRRLTGSLPADSRASALDEVIDKLERRFAKIWSRG